ncbi:GumC family protein [Sulfitobacter sp.]|uniref:GumC family protein n=1 Tax=Sulfitobacter sp. TaxID=1903071 RepID=UPI003564D93D
MDFRFYLQRFARRIHWFLLFLIIGGLGGLGAILYLPPIYGGHARLLMEAEQIPDELAASTVRTQGSEQLELIRQRILRRDTLLDLASRMNVYRHDPREVQLAPQDIVDDMRGRITMTIDGGGGSPTLATVGFEAPSPDLAEKVTLEIVDLILREDVDMRTKSAGKTLDFFTQKVAQLGAELAAQDAVILNFTEQNKQSLPDSLDFRRSQQATGQERLLQMERQIGALQERRARMQRRHELQATAGSGQFQTPKQQQLDQLEEELASQSTLLSPENPKLRILTARAAALRQRIGGEEEQASSFSETLEPMDDFALQQAEMTRELEFLSVQKQSILEGLADLSRSIDATTANAVTLGNLRRAQANTRVQYDQTVANMARAETGEMIEALRQGQKLTVFEGVTVPDEPVAPNRRKFITMGVLGGGAFGLALILMIEGMNRAMRRPEDLTAALGITPFATLPYLKTRAEIFRRRAYLVGLTAAVVIAVPLAFWAAQTQAAEKVKFAPFGIVIGADATGGKEGKTW